MNFAKLRAPYSARLVVTGKTAVLALPESDDAKLLKQTTLALDAAVKCDANRSIKVLLDYVYAAAVALKKNDQEDPLATAAADDALDALEVLGNMIRHNFPGALPKRTPQEAPAS